MSRVLYVDFGLTWGHGWRLQQDGEDVKLYIPYVAPYPRYMDYLIGYGFLPKVTDINEVVDNVDYIIFGDIGWGHTIERLRKEGKKVWGAGIAENLEMDRIFSAKVMDRLGILYPKKYYITGLSKLEEFIKDHGTNYCVKPNYFRGDFESFLVRDVDINAYLADLGQKLGPFKESFEFVVEDLIDGVMIGVDTWMSPNGKFVRPLFMAFEIHMDAVGRFTETSVFDDVLDKLEGYFASLGYVGNFSLEAMWDGENLYVIDFCTRMPITMGYIFPAFFYNYKNFVTSVLSGEKPEEYVDTNYYYAIKNVFYEDIKEKWVRVDIPGAYFTYTAKLGDNIYSIPHKNAIVLASVFGKGRDYNDALMDASRKVDEGLLDNMRKFDEVFKRYRESIIKLGREEVWWL